MNNSLTPWVITGTLLLSGLSGCSTSFSPAPAPPGASAFGSISGQVHGGQFAITGASVYAYETSTAGYGVASTLLAGPVLTDANGSFSFPASTTCTPAGVVYLYSLGGDPGGSVANLNAGLLAVLGICPTDGLLVNAVVAPPATSAQISMNEVSTIAAAYALAGFATSATAIGNSGTALANTGLTNAANNASQMYIAVTPYGGGGAGALAATPNGNGIVPAALINTLANILAACINSASPYTPCTTLFSNDESGGGQTGTAPADTATAAIYLAQHPYPRDTNGNSLVSTLFNIAGSTANPFTPALATAPSDFAVALVFTGSFTSPYGIAIDSSGNAWVTNATTSGSVSVLSPLGVPLTGSPFGSGSLDVPKGLAIDQNGSAWVANTTGNSLVQLTSQGAVSATYTTDISSPNSVAIDASNNVWVANSASVTKISNTSSTPTFVTQTDNNQPRGITVSASGNVWVAEGADGITQDPPSDTSHTYTGYPATFLGLAADSAGFVWAADPGDTELFKFNSSGAIAASPEIATGPTCVAIDGSNNVFLSTVKSSSGTAAAGNLVYGVVELSSAATANGPPVTVGYTAGGQLQSQEGIAVDGSGNVWVTNYSYKNTSNTTVAGTTVVEFLGLANPAVTPINPSQLSTKP
jgi:hypothetical protein